MGRTRALARVSARRGISPIVATVLLVLLAVAGAAVAWIVFHKAASSRPIVELAASAQATASPDGSACAVDLSIHNEGNVKLTIAQVTFTYNGKSVTKSVNRDLAPGATIGLSFTLSSSDFGTKFVDGSTVQVTIQYSDPSGNSYNKTIFATITSS